MLKNLFYIQLFLLSILKVSSQDLSKQENILYTSINDGPYVFIESNKLIQKTIVRGNVFTDTINTSLYNTSFSPNKEIYKNVRKIAALSDIHGQYDLAVEILKNNKIIDKNLNWCFGTGHLVVVGDIFDRGDKVNEMLLLVYKLEQEAKRKGGRVHLLLGNHEYMVLHKDLRYLNNKYKITCRLLNVDYDELYGKQTVLGRWLRSKPTIIKLNNTIFVHGGISKEFLSQNDFNIETINNLMRASIERDKTEMRSSGFYETFYGGNGLIWYRGYFYGGLDDMDISQILNITKSEHIVVGHCSNDKVVSLFDNKIFGVDSSIKKGKYGELLFVKNDKYYRKTLKGTKERFGNK